MRRAWTRCLPRRRKKTSVFHWVRKKETILALQLEWLGRLRQAIGRQVVEEMPDGERRIRVEQLYASMSVNSGRRGPLPYVDVKTSQLLSNAMILERLERVTYAQQSVLGQADALEQINWTDHNLQRKISETEKLHSQILQFKQPVTCMPPPKGKRRQTA